MTNDAKLGMLAGVLGVVVAAVLFGNAPPPEAGAGAASPEAAGLPQAPTAATPARPPPEASAAALPATPVPRTRKDLDAQPASRSADEEP
jgi:hypothetical protein